MQPTSLDMLMAEGVTFNQAQQMQSSTPSQQIIERIFSSIEGANEQTKFKLLRMKYRSLTPIESIVLKMVSIRNSKWNTENELISEEDLQRADEILLGNESKFYYVNAAAFLCAVACYNRLQSVNFKAPICNQWLETLQDECYKINVSTSLSSMNFSGFSKETTMERSTRSPISIYDVFRYIHFIYGPKNFKKPGYTRFIELDAKQDRDNLFHKRKSKFTSSADDEELEKEFDSDSEEEELVSES